MHCRKQRHQGSQRYLLVYYWPVSMTPVRMTSLVSTTPVRNSSPLLLKPAKCIQITAVLNRSYTELLSYLTSLYRTYFKPIYFIPNLFYADHILHRTYIPNLFYIKSLLHAKLILYRTFFITNLFYTELFIYQTYYILNYLDTESSLDTELSGQGLGWNFSSPILPQSVLGGVGWRSL
jgi:hypothetical protein